MTVLPPSDTPTPAFFDYVAAMQRALAFYADHSSWAIKGGDDISAPSWTEVTIDGGDKAREALAGFPR